MPGFPYANLPQQIAAAFVPPNQQFSNGSQYGRWNGVNGNAFGLFPNQFQGLFGYQPQGGGMQFMPPYGNNGQIGSNQGPGSNPGVAPGAYQGSMPQLPGSPMPKIGTDGGGLLGGITQSGGNYQAPQIPTNATPDNTAYSSQFMPTGANTQSAELQHALASGRLQGSYAQGLSQMPQSFSPAQFNQVAGQNPVLAEAMAAQMPQAGRNAIMAQNGWSNDQMNNFLNAYGSGAQPGFGPAQLQQLRSLGIG
ncbi:MAG: hypothetical protein ACTHKE_06295 [Sphingomicrobium sp.]